MTDFTFDNTVPAAPNDPSVDQPSMLINNQSIEGILAVDHVSFNTANGGQHLQVTFNSENVPTAPTDPQSVLYTNVGTASTIAQPFFRNQNGIFQVTPIKAWGLINGATGTIIATQSSNVASVVRNSPGNYSITLTTNAVNSANFSVQLSYQNGFPAPNTTRNPIYSITGTGTFNVFMTISSAFTNDVVNFSFLVTQI